MVKLLLKLAEGGLLPDFVLRFGIRTLLRLRLKEEYRVARSESGKSSGELLEEMNSGPIALVPEKANEQHYEVPADFFKLVMGEHMKYSSCYWEEGTESLDQAEQAMLELTCERAGLRDGIRVLELGCGWGSLSLWMAEHYPACQITVVSNSTGQKRFIDDRASARGLQNLEVVTADVNVYMPDDRFDLVLSVEMFEHMRNWAELLRRISGWLKDGGHFFMHVFCHRELLYSFDDRGSGDWMARHFFSGGLMPGYDLPLKFQQDLVIRDRWKVEGWHYERTAAAWLSRLDKNREDILKMFSSVYPSGQQKIWLNRWRIFFMACEELFGYRHGTEWLVGHYLYSKNSNT